MLRSPLVDRDTTSQHRQQAGEHGHRLLLQRPGAAAHAGWLAAIGHGLDGTVFAGLLPDRLRALAGVDGTRRAPLLALSFGQPLNSTSVIDEGAPSP